MHRLGCPCNNSHYAHCECASIDLRENTHQLQRFNEEMPVRQENERLHAELYDLKSTLREYLALSSIDGRAERQPLREKLKALCG